MAKPFTLTLQLALAKAYQADLDLFEHRIKSNTSDVQLLYNDYQIKFIKQFLSEYASFKQLNEIPCRYIELICQEYGKNISVYLPNLTKWMNQIFFKKCEKLIAENIHLLLDNESIEETSTNENQLKI